MVRALIIIISLVLVGGAIYLIISRVVPNRAAYWAGIRMWFMGNGTTPGRIEHLRKNALKIVTKALIILFAPLIILLLFEILGGAGGSIFFGLVVALISSWGSKNVDFLGRGLIYGVVAAVISFFLPWLFVGTITKAAWIFFALGWIIYLGEEISGAQIFPWWILHFCTAMFAFNVLQAAEAVVTGHNQLTASVVNWFYGHANSPTFFSTHTQAIVDIFPKVQHVWAEGGRVWNTLRQLVEAFQYVFAGVVILLVSAPGEISQWRKRKKGEKGEKTEGISTGQFFLYDLIMEMGLAVMRKLRQP